MVTYFVAEPRRSVHHDAARGVRRGAHALRHCDAEFELGAEDDGECECEAVRDGCDAEEHEGEPVDVPLCRRREELLPREGLGCYITAVGVQLVDDQIEIAGFLEETPRWLGFLLVGELDDEGKGEEGYAAGYHAFHDKDPGGVSESQYK